jgi:hypothetical protein
VRGPAVPALLAAAALAAGCAFSQVRSGDPRFLERSLDWQPGVTTSREVASALGPPDWIRSVGPDLVFVYRYQRDVRTSLVLQAYLNLFSSDRSQRVDSTLVAVFDAHDRLLYHGESEAVPRGGLPVLAGRVARARGRGARARGGGSRGRPPRRRGGRCAHCPSSLGS